VSAFLQGVDLGIATTPWEIIGKSATAAAMVDHGLPVIVSRDDVRFRVPSEPTPEPLLYKMDSRLPQWLISGPGRQAARSRLPGMADTFLSDLEAVSGVTAPRRHRLAATVG
jgi:hypothetical protein